VPELRPDHRKRQREQPDDASARQRPLMVRVRACRSVAASRASGRDRRHRRRGRPVGGAPRRALRALS
jgi:hypothetical protein